MEISAQNNSFNRRDFLKLLSLLPAAYTLAPDINFLSQDESQPNIIILVFDAWSARNISLYGYPRQTTPFLEKLADKAIVYHNHYSAANWTYSGTTGLLTGTHGWTNRGYSPEKPFLSPYAQKNIFSLFSTYFRTAYTHNHFADAVLQRMMNTIDTIKPRQDLFVNNDYWLANIFGDDYDIASTAWERITKKYIDGYANSLFLSRVFDSFHELEIDKYREQYPSGLPYAETDNYFNPETAIDWIIDQTQILSQPFLSYFHLLPPHTPYNTRREFFDRFEHDVFDPVTKPEHILSTGNIQKQINSRCKKYDSYILLVDSEINRLYQTLETNGTLENTWLIITSDHGELFERGIIGHVTPSFHNPLVHIPLMIFPPGQQERIDVTTPTSAVDLIPTLLSITGQSVPDWLEGQILPPYNTEPDENRNIFSMDARYSSNQTSPFDTASIMLRRGDYKLTYLFGTRDKYEVLNGESIFELYNLKDDPEELVNLYETETEIAQTMREILFSEMQKNGAL